MGRRRMAGQAGAGRVAAGQVVEGRVAAGHRTRVGYRRWRMKAVSSSPHSSASKTLIQEPPMGQQDDGSAKSPGVPTRPGTFAQMYFSIGVRMYLRLRLLAVLFFLVVPVALAPVGAMAQQPASTAGATTSSATVHGMVVDPDNALIPGAAVTLTPASGKAQSTTSKSDGTYSIRGLATGIYTLNVTAPGFANFTKQAVRVTAGANLNQDVSMSLAEQIQQVDVKTDTVSLSVDPESNASATVITGAALDALSDDPDELQSELTALAGPSAGPNGGQIYIDGFTGGQLPPKSSILAIRINQNPFSAQYDQLGYGRIEILTKPGTSALHGNFMTQFGDKFLNTSTPFLGAANSQPDYHTLFFMGNVTGPIKDGMSFALSGSHRTIDNNSIINPTAFYASSATSTTLCAPGDLTCTSYPFPTTARALAEPQTRWDISPRLDMMLGAKNTLTMRYQYMSGKSNVSPAVNSALLTTGSDSSNSDQAIQISETQLINSKVINETRFEYEHNSSNSTPLNTAPGISVQGYFNVGGGSTSSGSGNHVEVQNYTSVQLAKNFARFGGRLRTSSESNYSNGGINGSFSYTALLDPCTDPNVPMANKPSNCVYTSIAPQSSDPTGYICATSTISSYQCGFVSQFGLKSISPNSYTIGARETDVGLYAEDDWKAKSNLTISYGARLEAQNVINSGHDFAPRVSLAYGVPRKSGTTTTVLRGGFGVFYNRFSLGSIQSQIANNGQNSVNYTYSSPGIGCQPTPTGTLPYSSGCTTGAKTAATVTPTLNDPNLRSAYTIQSAATLEQQVGKYASVSVTYLNARGLHQFLTRSIPISAGSTTIDNINQSEGVFRQNQINANINVRTPKGINLFGFYSANWAGSNIGSITNPFSSSVDYGRAGFGVRSRMMLGGSIPLLYKISASPMIFAQSGSPYNVTLGTPDGVTLGFSDRPEFAPGVTAATANCLVASSFSNGNSLDSAGAIIKQIPGNQIPVNFCTGPANVSVHLRLSRTFGIGPKTAAALATAAAQAAQQQGGPGGPGGGGPPPGGGGGGGGRGGGPGGGGPGGGGPPGGGGSSSSDRKYSLTIGAQAMNLFNEVPYGNPISSLSNTQFGKTTSIAGGPFASQNSVRNITLQANFSF